MPLDAARQALKTVADAERKHALGDRLPESKRPKGMLIIFGDDAEEEVEEDEVEEG